MGVVVCEQPKPPQPKPPQPKPRMHRFGVSIALALALVNLLSVAADGPPCALVVSSDTHVFWFHIDVWPLPIDGNNAMAHEDTELESPVSVANRFRQKIAADRASLCVVSIAYPLYTYYALRDHDQLVKNAPLAVQKFEDQKKGNNGNNKETMTEVWRHVAWTTDEAVRNKFMGTANEHVIASASMLSTNISIISLVTMVVLLFL